ncbi:hypothetical protein [Methylobacterium sp. J-076]|uniref:hypothetical protein n=1 Tax=Methylobacterium sp. J-076 TaxID=2836655 RepID=UPI001FBB1A9B|nr:hypothetical protein [Methylobacterium sp. J-076]MCJ2011441.1 hypothetical protein [Methylobacterium sp. J-076]
MTDKPLHSPGSAGDHTLRPDPAGKGDPLNPPPGGFGLRPDPDGRHDPLPGAASASVDRAADKASALGDRASETASDLGDKASDLADRARERISGLADDIHDRLGGSADQVRDRAGAVYDEARERAGELHRRHMRRLDDLTVQGLDGLRRSRTNVERFVEDNPLLVGVVGVAAGLLLGALLPRTRQEDRNIGPYADEVRDQGLRYAREMTHRGREFVQTALDPDNLNEVVRKATEGTDDKAAPPVGERTQHTL